MIKKRFILFLFTLFLLFTSITLAQERPTFNFGSMQSVKDLNIIPGEEITPKLYFYNVYGNRITHIKLTIAESPKNWDVTLDPATHEKEYDVSGIPTTVEENIYIEPGEAVQEPPEDVPEGIEYITSKVGYVPAKAVEIKIKAPENEKLGETFNLKIDATAFWLGQAGTIQIQQGRTFDYTITTTSEEFYEKPMGVTGAAVRGIMGSSTIVGILITVIVVLAAVIIILLIRKRRFY